MPRSSSPPKPVAATNGTLTTHHLLKLVALAAMTAGHIGAYLYPDHLWLRAFGRLSSPIFLFLIGQALSYQPRRAVLLWGMALAILNPMLGNPVMPLNSLITIVLCQLLLIEVERRDWFTRYPATLLVASVIFLLPSYIVVEYGSLAFLYGLLGYAVRTGQIHTRAGYALAAVALASYLAVACLSFHFTLAQELAVIVGVTLLTIGLTQFRHRPVTASWLPAPAKTAAVAISRSALQYYVIHRVILQGLGMALGIGKAGLRWIA